MNTCDDCGKVYEDPPYYTFPTEACHTFEGPEGQEVEVSHDCTENMCPSCAGPYLEPDIENDPRRPKP